MPDEDGFLHAIKANTDDDTARLVYADWLDDRDDPRGDFVRLHLALRAASPDHPERVAGENELSHLRKGCDSAWLAIIEPEGVQPDDPTHRRGCDCFNMGSGKQKRKWLSPYLHTDAQDTECDVWKRLLDAVEEAAADQREAFSYLEDISSADRSRIVTLPPTIAKLKAVKSFGLYGSYLVRIPPEIGAMTSLEDFDPYTSYRLHWLPYEITRCKNLQVSRVSTRALYGNFKHRPPFPRVDCSAPTAPGRHEPERLPLKRSTGGMIRLCSVCARPFEDHRLHRVWVSLKVATDVLPLLVNACSEDCIKQLPSPPEGYVATPHKGGPLVQQPPPRY
jgi:uncharacterized protein (TIGR02996 family)